MRPTACGGFAPPGACRAPPSTPPGRSPRRQPRAGGEGRGLWSTMRGCSRRSAATSIARPSPARGTARSGPACAPSMASASARTGCCASCARMLCSRRTAARRGQSTTTTDASPPTRPGVMWGTDAAGIPTVEDGNIALFVVVEHWNAEALGWHVAEKADRFAAAQALDLAIHTACGAVRADAARGLLLRHDHGSAFMSDPFQNQIAFLGLTPSFAFVRQPETNGVAERFIRTLKEQVVWGRIFRNAEEVRVAVRAFIARYNEHWLLEKNAYRSPAQTRREWFAALASIKAAA